MADILYATDVNDERMVLHFRIPIKDVISTHEEYQMEHLIDLRISKVYLIGLLQRRAQKIITTRSEKFNIIKVYIPTEEHILDRLNTLLNITYETDT